MSEIRLRRHIDGRIAISTELAEGPYRWIVWPPHGRLTDEHVTGPGWTELFVAKLPKPDDEISTPDRKGADVNTPTWKLSFGESVTAWIEGVETPVWELREEDLSNVRSDALKMLAAVAACERYRAEQKNPAE